MESKVLPQAFEPDARAGCWLAVLDARGLSAEDITRLSAAERLRYDAMRSAERKRQWLAARLAAKHLFLHRLEIGFEEGARPWRPVLTGWSRPCLDAFPGWMYRAIDIVPGEDGATGPPRMSWLGADPAACVSLSHTRHLACACLARCVVGVDMEFAAPRVDSFYRSHYSDTERQWVDRCAIDAASDRDWLYTFLWTVKEAALKARTQVRANAWSFAGVDVGALPPPEDVLRICRPGGPGDRFGLFAAVVHDHDARRRTDVQIACTTRAGVILTVMTPSSYSLN